MKFRKSNCEICVTLFAKQSFFIYNGNVNIKKRTPINAELINSQLSNGYLVHPLFETINSTNTYIKEHVETLNDGSIIISKHQSSGRGRYERLFESNDDCGIYCSFLLKNNLELIQTHLNLKIACALHFSIYECFGIVTEIKWPNDIIINKKKCAGILIETNYQSRFNNLNAIIVGWGLNVYNQPFMDSIKDIATTLESHTNIHLDRNMLILHFFKHLDDFLYRIDILDYYKLHMIPINNWVSITINNAKELVQIIDIDMLGQLIVKTKNNQLLTLFNEEIMLNK